jgi:hypothetical protein
MLEFDPSNRGMGFWYIVASSRAKPDQLSESTVRPEEEP